MCVSCPPDRLPIYSQHVFFQIFRISMTLHKIYSNFGFSTAYERNWAANRAVHVNKELIASESVTAGVTVLSAWGSVGVTYDGRRPSRLCPLREMTSTRASSNAQLQPNVGGGNFLSPLHFCTNSRCS